MSCDLLCAWFGLPAGAWPPDHYHLLGLNPGETSSELIEQKVQQRLEVVRGYQMLHPEQATEAMNRLAQALICLSDPQLKCDYDRDLLENDTVVEVRGKRDTHLDRGPPPLPAPAKPPPLPACWVRENTIAEQTTEEPATEILTPPVKNPGAAIESKPASEAEPGAPEKSSPEKPLPVPAVESERLDPILEAARAPSAWRGLGTCWSLRRRITLTSKLLVTWEKLGTYCLSGTSIQKRSQEKQVIDLLGLIVQLLEQFPPILGKAGQPGYLVVSLNQCEILATFRELDPAQRNKLEQDWDAGKQLLETHARLLQEELQARAKQPLRQRLCRVAMLALSTQPGFVALLLFLIAINAFLWCAYACDWSFLHGLTGK